MAGEDEEIKKAEKLIYQISTSNGESMIIAKILLIGFLSIQVQAEQAVKNVQPIGKYAKSQQAVVSFVKKYWRPGKYQVLTIKDNMSKVDRIDLKNKYFNVSYPNCISAKPSEGGGDEKINLKNTGSIDFDRTLKCKNFKDKHVSNWLGLWYSREASDQTVERYHDFYMKPKFEGDDVMIPAMFMHQHVSVNGQKARIIGSVMQSNDDKKSNEVVMRWQMFIVCEGKKNTEFEFSFMTESYDQLLEFVTTKNYEIPEDFMQIISTFKCRKDR